MEIHLRLFKMSLQFRKILCPIPSIPSPCVIRGLTIGRLIPITAHKSSRCDDL